MPVVRTNLSDLTGVVNVRRPIEHRSDHRITSSRPEKDAAGSLVFSDGQLAQGPVFLPTDLLWFSTT
jgi:hypothetical protein